MSKFKELVRRQRHKQMWHLFPSVSLLLYSLSNSYFQFLFLDFESQKKVTNGFSGPLATPKCGRSLLVNQKFYGKNKRRISTLLLTQACHDTHSSLRICHFKEYMLMREKKQLLFLKCFAIKNYAISRIMDETSFVFD